MSHQFISQQTTQNLLSNRQEICSQSNLPPVTGFEILCHRVRGVTVAFARNTPAGEHFGVFPSARHQLPVRFLTVVCVREADSISLRLS